MLDVVFLVFNAGGKFFLKLDLRLYLALLGERLFFVPTVRLREPEIVSAIVSEFQHIRWFGRILTKSHMHFFESFFRWNHKIGAFIQWCVSWLTHLKLLNFQLWGSSFNIIVIWLPQKHELVYTVSQCGIHHSIIIPIHYFLRFHRWWYLLLSFRRWFEKSMTLTLILLVWGGVVGLKLEIFQAYGGLVSWDCRCGRRCTQIVRESVESLFHFVFMLAFALGAFSIVLLRKLKFFILFNDTC